MTPGGQPPAQNASYSCTENARIFDQPGPGKAHGSRSSDPDRVRPSAVSAAIGTSGGWSGRSAGCAGQGRRGRGGARRPPDPLSRQGRDLRRGSRVQDPPRLPGAFLGRASRPASWRLSRRRPPRQARCRAGRPDLPALACGHSCQIVLPEPNSEPSTAGNLASAVRATAQRAEHPQEADGVNLRDEVATGALGTLMMTPHRAGHQSDADPANGSARCWPEPAVLRGHHCARCHLNLHRPKAFIA
jgi:hypothetical protein